jgi:hypothetical protein
MNTNPLSTLPAVLPRKKAHDSANFSPVRGAAGPVSLKGDRRRAEVCKRILLGDRPKVIAHEVGMSINYVYITIRDRGISLMAVTAAERAEIMAARKRGAS